MRSWTANGKTRLLAWQRVREFAVPPAMIETATARRMVGDWAGACAAARVDADLQPRAVARTHGRDIASRLRADLRHLAPDLLRWHFPRVAPDGLLRPGVTVALARYDSLHLVARTPPAWADAGQRISLALWTRAGDEGRAHPHPRPDRRFRLDLHRHLWDARRVGELRQRACPEGWTAGSEYATHRWGAEARLLLDADRRPDGPVLVRLDDGRRLLLSPSGGPHSSFAGPSLPGGADSIGGSGPPLPWPVAGGRSVAGLPVLPDAAVRVPPDLELLRAGLIHPEQLHPLVAAALAPDAPPRPANDQGPGGGLERVVDCGGARHRIGLAGGRLAPLDHDPAELRREELLAALGGTPMPCLRAVAEAVHSPENLDDVRARIDHGDYAGALNVVEALLGPDALLRSAALHDEWETAARRRLTHGMFRAGLTGYGPPRHETEIRRRRERRTHPRHAKLR
ncbi:hypothetical protein AB0F81_05960 [Actinoplanes sp. NPDC024001]|uniref:hypothetical protein n=1 Tax=Actinoplanes sp. NPDC024001 TaxID=3154598 RepID=UPI003405992E